MWTRWIKRGFWIALVLALVLAPAQLAQGPSGGQPVADNLAARPSPFLQFSVPAAIVVLLTAVAFLLLWKRRHHHV